MKRGELIPVEARFETPTTMVVSGPSGVGKGTIVAALMQQLETIEPDRKLSRSWTSRPQRIGEADDSYTFVDREAFELAIAEGRFLEWTEFRGNYYGTPVPNQDEKILLEIEVDGANEVRRRAIRSHSLGAHQFYYILAEDPLDLVTRLFGRNDHDSKVNKVGRFATFLNHELQVARELGAHVVVNRTIEGAVDNILASMSGDFQCDPELDQIIRKTEVFGPEILAIIQRMYLAKES